MGDLMLETATETVFSEPRKPQSFHFSVGSSDSGPIGWCSRVIAFTPAEAVAVMRNIIEERGQAYMVVENEDSIEYFQVYLNPEVLTEDDIDDSEDVQCLSCKQDATHYAVETGPLCATCLASKDDG
jgi:hypothetical protein